MATQRPRHFSMIRGFHLADFLTLGNAACGAGSIFLAMVYVSTGSVMAFYAACALAPERAVLLAPARDAPVADVEDESRGHERRGDEQAVRQLALQVGHHRQHRAHAAEGIGDGEPVREVEAADHREVGCAIHV